MNVCVYQSDGDYDKYSEADMILSLQQTRAMIFAPHMD